MNDTVESEKERRTDRPTDPVSRILPWEKGQKNSSTSGGRRRRTECLPLSFSFFSRTFLSFSANLIGQAGGLGDEGGLSLVRCAKKFVLSRLEWKAGLIRNVLLSHLEIFD